MVKSLLHVEDDPFLANVVRRAFLAFGFVGEFFSAACVSEALDFMVRRREQEGGLDLILLDLRLPDGSGLDVLRSVKANPAWASTPVIVLSSEKSPEMLAEAYALGANSFVPKMSTDGNPFEALKSLYSYWVEAAWLPPGSTADPLRERLARAVGLRSRSGDRYLRLASGFTGFPEIMGFWLDRALSESNLANLFVFLMSQCRGRRADEHALHRISALQDEVERRLRLGERRLDACPTPTPDEAYAWILDELDAPHEQAFAEAMAVLFPIEPIATRALSARYVVQFEQICEFIGSHAGSPGLRAQALKLLGTAERLKKIEVPDRAPTNAQESDCG